MKFMKKMASAAAAALMASAMIFSAYAAQKTAYQFTYNEKQVTVGQEADDALKLLGKAEDEKTLNNCAAGNGAAKDMAYMYKDFDLTKIYDRYDTLLVPLIEACKKRQIVCLVPDKQNLVTLEENEAADKSIEEFTYCYVSPQGCWQDDFDYRKETFDTYAARHNWSRKLLGKVFGPANREKVCVTRKMNYNIK